MLEKQRKWLRKSFSFDMGVDVTDPQFATLVLGQPPATFNDDNYSTNIKEAMRNVYAMAAISAKARAVAGIPLELYELHGDNERPTPKDHELLKLMKRPNPEMGYGKFMEAVVYYTETKGDCYVNKAGPPNGAAKELYLLRPDRIKIIPNPDDMANPVKYYEYRINNNVTQIKPSEILHIKKFHPMDDYYGLSPLKIALRFIRMNNAATEWNVSLLENMARPSGTLSSEARLSETERIQLKNDINTQYSGAKNASSPILLDGGLKWDQVSLSPAELDFIQGFNLSVKALAINWHIPSEMMGDAENKTYSNWAEGRKAFYMETILPYMDWLMDELNNWLTPQFGENLELKYDLEGIEALQEDRELLWMRAADGLMKGLITRNEAREIIKYDSVENGDVFYMPTNMIPVGINNAANAGTPAPTNKQPPAHAEGQGGSEGGATGESGQGQGTGKNPSGQQPPAPSKPSSETTPTAPTQTAPTQASYHPVEFKPYPNEHACRLVDPNDFVADSFHSMFRNHKGKKYRVIMGTLKTGKQADQAFRYPKDTWTEADARAHCKAHDGIEFAAATGSQS